MEVIEIIPEEKYPGMYRLQWPNGDISVSTPHPEREGGHYGFYNDTRVEELSRRLGIENYTKGRTYNAPAARLEARGCV
jgi:hypothetical protein